jgi:hypothetical protein
LLKSISARLDGLGPSSRKIRWALVLVTRRAGRIGIALRRIESGIDRIDATMTAHAKDQSRLLEKLQEQNRLQTATNEHLRRIVSSLNVLPLLIRSAQEQSDRQVKTQEMLNGAAADLKTLGQKSDRLLITMSRLREVPDAGWTRPFSGSERPSLLERFYPRRKARGEKG